MTDPVGEEQEIDPEYVESHLQVTMGLIWDQVTTALGNQAGLLSSGPKVDLQPRPPRLGVGAAPARSSGTTMTRDAVRLQGRLVGGKRKRNENDDDVMPFTNGVASKSRDNDSSEEESRAKAVSKEKPKSVSNRFPIPVSNKKKPLEASTLVNGAAAAPHPSNLFSTPGPALSKARSPRATTNGVPILFPTTSSEGTPAPHRTPSPARSTSISFGGSHTTRSISKAARRSLKQKAIFQKGRLEIINLETPREHTGNLGVKTDPRSPPHPKYQVNKGKGKEKETEGNASAHVPLIDLGSPTAKGKTRTPPPREDDPVISPTTPHPPRIRQSLPICKSGKSVLQLEPIAPITEPNQERDSPKKKKRNRRHRKKKHQQPAEEGIPKAVSASMVNPSDEEE